MHENQSLFTARGTVFSREVIIFSAELHGWVGVWGDGAQEKKHVAFGVGSCIFSEHVHIPVTRIRDSMKLIRISYPSYLDIGRL